MAPSRIGVSGFVPVWARIIFSSSCVVGRAWCLASAALLLAAAWGGRARCARLAVRRACACCCPAAAADAAAVRAPRLSRCQRAGPAQCWQCWLVGVRCTSGRSASAACGVHGVVRAAQQSAEHTQLQLKASETLQRHGAVEEIRGNSYDAVHVIHVGRSGQPSR